MARKVGIRENTRQTIVSGARVPFDPRGTAEANDTRDPKNYKAAEQFMRKEAWEERQREGTAK
jgi:hypothetical protein